MKELELLEKIARLGRPAPPSGESPIASFLTPRKHEAKVRELFPKAGWGFGKALRMALSAYETPSRSVEHEAALFELIRVVPSLRVLEMFAVSTVLEGGLEPLRKLVEEGLFKGPVK